MALSVSKSEATRDRILTAALELFQQRGFEATTMRDIADRAGMAVGAAYYYFRTKDDLVMAFYAETSQAAAEANQEICSAHRSVEARVAAILHYKLAQFGPHRKFLRVLFARAGDPESSLSPFSPETQALREQAIQIFRDALQDTPLPVADDLRPYLPWLFWLYQLGILLFWIHDRSPNQRRTRTLMEYSLPILFQLLKMTRLPFLRSARRSLVRLFATMGINAQEVTR